MEEFASQEPSENPLLRSMGCRMTTVEVLAWLPLQSLAVKKKTFSCANFGAVGKSLRKVPVRIVLAA